MSDIINVSGESNTKDMLGAFHDKKLLEVLEANVELLQFAVSKPITTTNGLTITFHTLDSFEEGTRLSSENTDPTSTGITAGVKTASVIQFGAIKRFSELYEKGAVVSIVDQSQVRFGYAAARTIDKYIQNVLVTGSNPGASIQPSAYLSNAQIGNISAYFTSIDKTQADSELRIGFYSSGDLSYSDSSFAAVASSVADLTADMSLNVKAIRNIVTELKMSNVMPCSDGNYAIAVTPKETANIRASEEFVSWNQYSNADKMFKGEVGLIEGARLVESTNLINLKPIQTNVKHDAYLNFAFGSQCFAVTEFSGDLGIKSLKVPFSAQDHSNVLQLYASVGWKWTGAVSVLDPRQGRAYIAMYT